MDNLIVYLCWWPFLQPCYTLDGSTLVSKLHYVEFGLSKGCHTVFLVASAYHGNMMEPASIPCDRSCVDMNLTVSECWSVCPIVASDNSLLSVFSLLLSHHSDISCITWSNNFLSSWLNWDMVAAYTKRLKWLNQSPSTFVQFFFHLHQSTRTSPSSRVGSLTAFTFICHTSYVKRWNQSAVSPEEKGFGTLICYQCDKLDICRGYKYWMTSVEGTSIRWHL